MLVGWLMPMENKSKGTDRSPQEMARPNPAMKPWLWYRMLSNALESLGTAKGANVCLFVLLNEGKHNNASVPGCFWNLPRWPSKDTGKVHCLPLQILCFSLLNAYPHILGCWLNKAPPGSSLPPPLLALFFLRTSPVPSKYFLLWWPPTSFFSVNMEPNWKKTRVLDLKAGGWRWEGV